MLSPSLQRLSTGGHLKSEQQSHSAILCCSAPYKESLRHLTFSPLNHTHSAALALITVITWPRKYCLRAEVLPITSLFWVTYNFGDVELQFSEDRHWLTGLNLRMFCWYNLSFFRRNPELQSCAVRAELVLLFVWCQHAKAAKGA